MGEWEIDLKKTLVDMFWWNSKPFKKLYPTFEKKKDFYSVYKINSWKVKIRLIKPHF